MADFSDFRVVVTPNIQAQGGWSIALAECPVDGLVGPMGTTQIVVTLDELKRLRNHNGWPNLAQLRLIGRDVWQSLMTVELYAAFRNCLMRSQDQGRGLRLVISIMGEQSQAAANDAIRLQELPLEALYHDQLNFLAPNPATPVSRSLTIKPDRNPYHIALPLRILVVVATPTDKPAAQMQKEKEVIQTAMADLSRPEGPVQLEFCDPPTRAELSTRLPKGFHVLHFVGHGAFDIEGNDPSPRAHLCLEKPNRESDPLDAKTLDILLQGWGVGLVVMTTCASAEPRPEDVRQTAGSFDGVAQTLIAGNSGVNAVVAMQFDLESQAAVVFSKAFYSELVSSGGKLDEVVTLCRKRLIAEMDAGHRAWVNPVVYWRCKEGRVFDIDLVRKEPSEQIRTKLTDLDSAISVYLEEIKRVKSQPPEIQNAAAPLIAQWQQIVDDLQQQRGSLLGETVRLHGSSARAGEAVVCRLTFRLRTPARVGRVNVRIRYPRDKVTYTDAAAGANVAADAPMINSRPALGELTLLLQNASEGVPWTPNEYELVLFTFQVQAGVTDPFLKLSVADARVQRDGADTHCEALSAVIFVSGQG